MGGRIRSHAAFSLRLRRAMQEAGRAVEERVSPGHEDARAGEPSRDCPRSGAEASAAPRSQPAAAHPPECEPHEEAYGGTNEASYALARTQTRIAESIGKMHPAWREFYLAQAEALAAQLAKEALDE